MEGGTLSARRLAVIEARGKRGWTGEENTNHFLAAEIAATEKLNAGYPARQRSKKNLCDVCHVLRSMRGDCLCNS